MKFQGWTFLRKRICSIVVLATFPTFAFQLSLAQDSTSAPPLLLQDSGPSLIPNSEPALPGIRVGSDPATSLDEELGLLRNELKAFHSKR
ncbi:MAG: hypothetical protein FJ267_12610, partial [Planctomycetes bacterium]|nr:hypothetical protein [Planctomycetota bacterium]